MMLIDAGPLVALAAPRDPNHPQCAEVAAAVTSAMLTTWPVVTEAVWVGRRWPDFVTKLNSLFESRALGLYSLLPAALAWMTHYMVQYENLHPDLADASLMYVADRERIDTIFTLDRRDFNVYRTSRNRALKIVP
jgi:predicted nucleic acid-binding protein